MGDHEAVDRPLPPLGAGRAQLGQVQSLDLQSHRRASRVRVPYGEFSSVGPRSGVSVRAIPERKVASISRHVTLAEADAFFAGAFPRLRAVAPGMPGIEGVPFVVYYGEVSADSDGPVELCRPVAMDIPEGAVAGSADIQVRVEPAHEEAYVRLSVAEMSWPGMLPFADALERWGRAHGRRPAAPLRQVLFADLRTASPDTQACDLSVPLR